MTQTDVDRFSLDPRWMAFLARIREARLLPGAVPFFILPLGTIRTFNLLSLTSEEDYPIPRYCCPLTYPLDGFGVNQYIEAGQQFGFTESEASAIAHAADNDESGELGVDLHVLRQNLIDACVGVL